MLSDTDIEALMRAYPLGGYWCDGCHLYGPGEPESDTCPVCGADLYIWKKSDIAAVESYVGPFDRFMSGPLIEVQPRTGQAISAVFTVAVFTFLVTLPLISMDLLDGLYSVLTSPVAFVSYISGVYAAFIFSLLHTGLLSVSKAEPAAPEEEKKSGDLGEYTGDSRYV
jgi:hypothetical protein